MYKFTPLNLYICTCENVPQLCRMNVLKKLKISQSNSSMLGKHEQKLNNKKHGKKFKGGELTKKGKRG